MARYMLEHTHAPAQCRTAFAAWRGFDSPLRHHDAMASCANGASGADDHQLWWTVEAASADEALAQLPEWVAERTRARSIHDVTIP